MARRLPDHFPTTRWTLILEARGDRETQRRALEELFVAYWRPLYLYARHLGLGPADAEDAVQGLLASLLARDFLRGVDPDKGRLRHYLRAALRNHLSDLHQKATAAKRGGNDHPIAIDGATAERLLVASPGHNPEAAYDRIWAVQLLENSFERLRDEFARGLRDGPFELVEHHFSLAEAVTYDELARRFAMSVPQLKSFLHRARARFRELVADEVAHTVEHVDEIEDELQYLRALLSTQ